MNLRKFYYFIIIPLFLFHTGCSKTKEAPKTINEAEILAQYIVNSDNPLENHKEQTLIDASIVNSNILSGTDQYVIDTRKEEDYEEGHIKGAVNVSIKKVLEHYETNNLKSKKIVVVACYSGHTASWVTSLLHMMGYTNVRIMKWGMSSWNSKTSKPRNSKMIGTLASSGFVQIPTPKPAKGKLPKLNTGKTTAKDILRARVETVFAEGSAIAKISNNKISNHFIANYWKPEEYNWGHIEGAVQYSPKKAFTLDDDLKTLPTDKKIAVYCHTGQASALVVAYLRVLGYDAKFIAYGVNGMAYKDMPGPKFNPSLDIHNYELVK